MNHLSTVERAFALAQSGECRSIEDIRRRLREEQFASVDEHLAGKLVKQQLLELCANARTP